MSNREKSGGPAFPRAGFYPNTEDTRGDIDSLRERLPTVTEPEDGMTLRDYFAAKAMAAVVTGLSQGGYPRDAGMVATTAYELADAMIEARKQ